MYDPYSGVTNNQAEGLNYVLKQLQEWKEAPVDCMLLALHYLQGYYRVEIACGHAPDPATKLKEPKLATDDGEYALTL